MIDTGPADEDGITAGNMCFYFFFSNSLKKKEDKHTLTCIQHIIYFWIYYRNTFAVIWNGAQNM